MPELTTEQLQKAETMSLEELRTLALQEAEEPPPQEASSSSTTVVDTGKGELDNSTEIPEDEEQIFRKEIHNPDGTVDVYEAASVDELIDKIAEGKRNAVAQMKAIAAEKHALESKVQKTTEDEEYVIQQRLQKEPKKVILDVVAQAIAERESALLRSQEAQSRFVVTHPDYIADIPSGNGERMVAEFRRLFPAEPEFTYEGLEKAYQSLKASGLLKLKTEGSEEATAVVTAEPARTEQPAAETTQPRSQRKGSNLSGRSTIAPKVETEPSLDEAYSLPMDKLRELANKQLAGRAE